MFTNITRPVTRVLLGAVSCALFAGIALAKDNRVTVSIHVNTHGLDVNQPADARTIYTRLQSAAYVACTRGDRVNLSPVDDVRACVEKALGGAIRAAKAPLLTQIYLESHTLQQAAKVGIEVPAQVASK